MMWIISTLVIILSGCPGITRADDWPTYRADAARSAYTEEAIPNGLKLRWTYRSKLAPRPAWPTSDQIDFDRVFQPIIMGDLVLFGSSVDDQVRAIDAKTGRVRWTFFTGAPVRFAPAGWKDRVFVVSDDGWIYALALKDGSLIWKFRGGPGDELILGNERVISKWRARGGPVVVDGVVCFSAGIWPSDEVYIHALNAETGQPLWSNGETGKMLMKQPHGGAEARSGVSAQGYLAASGGKLLVPTGRAVPAVFDRSNGKLLYYQLSNNQKRGGSRAVIADRFFLNSGCLFDLETGDLASRIGMGAAVALARGIVQANGKSLTTMEWQDKETFDRKGNAKKVRALIDKKLTATDRQVLEFIVAGGDAICGQDGQVCAVDYNAQQNIWWKHQVEGKALGLAAGGGRLIVSTDKGLVYCFDGEPGGPPEETEDDAPEIKGDTRLAREILNGSETMEGFCVELGMGNGEEKGKLALSLARQSKLHIYLVEKDPVRAAASRKLLNDAGVYGSRVTVMEADPAETRLPRNFANLVVALSLDNPAVKVEAERLQRPYGGKLCSGRAGKLRFTERGALEGAGNWTHQNAGPANTLCSDDVIVRGPLSMLWFRDVDFEIPNRHGQGPAPLVNNGHLIVGGVDGIACLDAFNGRTIWIFDLKGNLKDYDGIHHDVAVGETGSNFCLSDDAVFVRNGDRCLRIELASGKVSGEFHTPLADANSANRNWGYLAFHDGLLYGSVLNDSHRVSPRYKLTSLRTESVSLFAMDAKTGDLRWNHKAEHSIRNNSIAIAGEKVYLIDRPLIDADNISNPKRNGRSGKKLTPEEVPAGSLIALKAATGKEVWRNEEDIFGTELAVSEQHSILLMNYEAVRHHFFGLPSEIGGRLAGFDLETGKKKWDRDAEYQSRPIINDYTIYAQGGAWSLITGDPIKFDFQRSYGCGQISSSRNLMLFRSATLGYRDLSRNAGTENYGGIRLGCWINAIPADGLVFVPDGSSKCNCSYQMKAWFALQPTK